MAEPSKDVESLANFKEQTGTYLRRLNETGAPLLLTAEGGEEVVVQNAAAYRRLVELAARSGREETLAAIRKGLVDAEAGRVKPARETVLELATKHGISVSDV